MNTNNINGNLKYRGIVKISVLKGKKLIKTINHHNAGTTWLFQVLSSMLCGNDERLNVPRYFDMGNLTEPTTVQPSIFESAIANRIVLSAKVIDNFQVSETNPDNTIFFNGSYGAVFTALVPSLQLVSTKAEILRLYSTKQGGDETLLAQVTLDNPLSLDYALGYNYMIEWLMTFENALTQSNTTTN